MNDEEKNIKFSEDPLGKTEILIKYMFSKSSSKVEKVQRFFRKNRLILIIVSILIICILSVPIVLGILENQNVQSETYEMSTNTTIISDYIRAWENIVVYEYILGSAIGGDYISTSGNNYLVFEKDSRNCIAYNISLEDNIDIWANQLGTTEEETEQILSSYSAGQEFEELDIEEIENLFEYIIENKKQYIRDTCGNTIISKLTNNQLNALIEISYRYGDIGNFAETYIYYENGEIETFVNSFEVEGGIKPLDYNSGDERTIADWTLFDAGTYNANGIILYEEDY